LSALLRARGLAVQPERLLKAQADEHARASSEAPEIERARQLFPAEKIWTVPVMAGDVRGLADLAKVARALMRGSGGGG
jgi:hypothetical protein